MAGLATGDHHPTHRRPGKKRKRKRRRSKSHDLMALATSTQDVVIDIESSRLQGDKERSAVAGVAVLKEERRRRKQHLKHFVAGGGAGRDKNSAHGDTPDDDCTTESPSRSSSLVVRPLESDIQEGKLSGSCSPLLTNKQPSAASKSPGNSDLEVEAAYHEDEAAEVKSALLRSGH